MFRGAAYAGNAKSLRSARLSRQKSSAFSAMIDSSIEITRETTSQQTGQFMYEYDEKSVFLYYHISAMRFLLVFVTNEL